MPVNCEKMSFLSFVILVYLDAPDYLDTPDSSQINLVISCQDIYYLIRLQLLGVGWVEFEG